MKLRRLLKAAFSMKNFTLLSGVLIISYLTEYLPFFLIGMAGYLFFTLQTFNSQEFQSEQTIDDKLEELDKLSRECNSIYNRVSRSVDKNIRYRLKKVLQEKDELMAYYDAQRDDFLKQKIVEQALNLVIVYVKLIYNYFIKQKEFGMFDVNDIAARLDRNKRKLEFLKDERAVDELSKAIKMDESLLDEIREERRELERISARLEYIESAINNFKLKIISQDESDPELTDIESVINEASALDNALNNKTRLKM